MNRNYRLYLICLFLIIPTALKAQVFEIIQQALNAHEQTFQEKIFVQTDKENYVAGELLWFKVYNVNAANRKATRLSKLVYIELLDQNNTPLIQTKVELKEGKGEGSFYLPSNTSNGVFRFRAYTNWMKNFGEAQLFEKAITIINTLSASDSRGAQKITDAIHLQFYAEGGDMVEGLPCTLAFKATGKDGKGIPLNGVIINQKNDTVARFETLKFGMGKFSFTPLPGQTYKAVAGTSNKEVLIRELPVPKKQGYALSLAAGKKPFIITVHSNTQADSVYCFVHNGTKTSFAERGNILNGKAVFEVNPDLLNEGINLFTIFSEEGRAVAERLYFKRPSQRLNVEAKSDFSIYESRKKVNVGLQTKNETGKPMPAEFSVSVRRLDSLQGEDHDNIESYLWLSSEIKGNIESPTYYFDRSDKETDVALDNLLLTQGWRRFNSDETLSRDYAYLKFLPEMTGHLLSGTLKTKNNQPKINNLVYMGVTGKPTLFYSALTDTSGRFVFNTKDFYGLNEVVIQTDTKRDTTSTITVESPFLEKFSTPFDFKAINLSAAQSEELKNYNISMQVQNIYAGAEINRFKELKIDSGTFYGKPFRTYFLDDYTRFPLMEDVLREYVKEVFVYMGQKDYHVKIVGKTDYLDENPMILLDGIPYFNMTRVMEIDPKKIKSLDIVNELYYYGPAIFEGILSFRSYKPNLANASINPNAVVLDYEGLQQQRVFYQPQYETNPQFKSRTPDFRNVLYWSGRIPVNEKGIADFSFYTSDLPGTYIGVINGISETGSVGSTTFLFKVKERP